MRRDSPKSLNDFYFLYLSRKRSLFRISDSEIPISQKEMRPEFNLDDISYVYNTSSNIDTWDGYNCLTLNSFRGEPLIHYCENENMLTDIMEMSCHPYHEDLTLGLSEDP